MFLGTPKAAETNLFAVNFSAVFNDATVPISELGFGCYDTFP